MEDIEEALEALEFRQEIQHVLVKIELLLEHDEAARLQLQTTTPSLGETSSGITKVNCKLPKLSLQTFDGDPAKWSSFWDTFEGQLTGKALITISGFLLSTENYKEAIKLLQERYVDTTAEQENLSNDNLYGQLIGKITIKCVKRCLKKILGTAKLSYDKLLTVVVDVEAILNSRPLTYLDLDDMVEPLTPHRILSVVNEFYRSQVSSRNDQSKKQRIHIKL